MKKKLREPRCWSIFAPGMKGPGLMLMPKGLFEPEVKKYGEDRHCSTSSEFCLLQAAGGPLPWRTSILSPLQS